jgi:hypothetical protein
LEFGGDIAKSAPALVTGGSASLVRSLLMNAGINAGSATIASITDSLKQSMVGKDKFKTAAPDGATAGILSAAVEGSLGVAGKVIGKVRCRGLLHKLFFLYRTAE